MTTKFTDRLREALASLTANTSMNCRSAKTNCLYTPTYSQGKYVWIKLMDSDGTLINERPIHTIVGEGAAPESETRLLLGVILQSEESTSQTKPNPLGKAALTHVPNGVWVDTEDGKRRRLDRFVVAFIMPKGAAPKHQKKFTTARKNVLNAAAVMPNAVAVEVERGVGFDALADRIATELRPFLVGKGRPRSEA